MAEAPTGFKEVSAAPEGFREVASDRGASQSPPYSDKHGPFVGAVLDTLGMTKRPGARTPLDVMAKPEGIPEHIARALASTGLIGLGGAGLGALASSAGLPSALAGAAPLVGRVATAGAMGAGEAAVRGDNPALHGLIDAAVAGLTEGAISGVTQLPKVGLKALGAGQRGFEHATHAPARALELIRHKLPGVKFVIPAIGKSKLTPEDAVKALSKLKGSDYILARAELADALTKAEAAQLAISGSPKALGPKAGAIFKKFTEPDRFDPKATARVAEATRRGISSPVGRSAADAVATEPVEGLPLGLYPLVMAPESLTRFSRRILPATP